MARNRVQQLRGKRGIAMGQRIKRGIDGLLRFGQARTVARNGLMRKGVWGMMGGGWYQWCSPQPL